MNEEVTDQEAYEAAIAYSNRPENKERIMAKFVKAFGQNAKVRTRKQWTNLVRVYSLKQVCEMEHMTEDEVNYKCLTLSQRLNAKAKIQRKTA